MLKIAIALPMALIATCAFVTVAEAKGGGGTWTIYLAKLGTRQTTPSPDDCQHRRGYVDAPARQKQPKPQVLAKTQKNEQIAAPKIDIAKVETPAPTDDQPRTVGTKTGAIELPVVAVVQNTPAQTTTAPCHKFSALANGLVETVCQ